jgi:hypothetical protein
MLRLQVRRFFCDNEGCSVRTFAEQVEGLTARHARKSPVLRTMLESIGLALAGRAGGRLARRLGKGPMPASGTRHPSLDTTIYAISNAIQVTVSMTLPSNPILVVTAAAALSAMTIHRHGA